MNVVTELKKERDRLEIELERLDQALVLLGTRALRGRMNGRVKIKKARRWSAASRRRQAARMRKMWKEGKIKTK